MSTVATFIEDIIDRIPENKANRIFTALNKAMKVIAKRLYLFESNLVKAELSIPVYAQVTKTAATIAFVSNKPDAADTITDSGSGFVTAGFKAGMAIETTLATNPGPYRITAVTAGTLTLDTAHTLTTQASGTSYTITSRDDIGYLPADFWGFFGKAKPYINGKDYPLNPLPSQDEKLNWYQSTGEPYFFELIGDWFVVTPPTSSDITVKGLYFQRPAALSSLEDTMPYQEIFDDVLQEYLVELLIMGTASGAAIQQQLMVGVDLVVAKREQKAPHSMPMAINWNEL